MEVDPKPGGDGGWERRQRDPVEGSFLSRKLSTLSSTAGKEEGLVWEHGFLEVILMSGSASPCALFRREGIFLRPKE